MDEVYVSWQNPESRIWHIVGRLQRKENSYIFNYTKGVEKDSIFQPFSGMENLESEYHSENLFPFFSNRILSSKRPEYKEYIRWLGLNENNADPLKILTRSEGTRGTDSYQVIKKFSWDSDGKFKHSFFSHGLRHFHSSTKELIVNSNIGDKVFLCLDKQNSFDKDAVLIRMDNPKHLIGYVPKFLSSCISTIIENENNSIHAIIKNISKDAPLAYLLRCEVSGVISTETKEILNNYLQEFEAL
ncbi:HIRAN domain-containing protein [Comamonas aquatica]|nr:HIRAN domain-containing protein [Comamonas aquatica]